MSNYIGAIDQGTTSTRFIVFDRYGRVSAIAQKEHEQIFPKPGWVEHDPDEIWRRTKEVIEEATQQKGLQPKDFAAIGITNQRETTIVWIARLAMRFTTPSCGRTHALNLTSHPSLHKEVRTASETKPVFRSPLTSAASKSVGYSITFAVPVNSQKPANSLSVTSTATSFGISPAA
jgi:hypothetical protein